MIAVNGYIDGNTVVATDESLRNFKGDEIIIRIMKKTTTDSDLQKRTRTTTEERLAALKELQGVLKGCKPISIEEIREARLAERYGL